MPTSSSLTPERATVLVERWATMQETYAPGWRPRWEHLIDRLDGHLAREAVSRPRLLDLGCGTGALTWRLAQRLPDADVLGLDSSAPLVEIAQLGLPELPRLRFRCDTGRPGPTLGGFDAIVSSAVPHYSTPQTVVDDCANLLDLLTPGGVVLHAETYAEMAPTPPGAPSPWETWWAEAAAAGVVVPTQDADPLDPPSASPTPSVSATDYCQAALTAGFASAHIEQLPGDDVLLVLVSP